MQELTAELELKLDKFNKQLDTALSKIESKGKNVGKTAGVTIGNNLVAGIGTALSSAKFGQIFNNLSRSFVSFSQSAIRVSNAELQLAGSVDVANNRLNAQRETLTDVTASYEEKATALGLDTDKIYENVKASTRATDIYEEEEKAIEAKQRALDAETDSLKQKLSIQERERDLAVQTLLRERGFGDLADKRSRQQIQIAKLEQERLEAENKGQFQQAFLIQEQIASRERNLDITKAEIQQISSQADIIKNKFEPAITDLQNKLDDPARNKVQIEIDDAKQKIDDLKNAITTAFSAGGAAPQISKSAKEFIDAQAEAIGKEAKTKGLINQADVDAALDRLEEQFGSRLTRAQLGKPLGDLIFEGLDVAESEQLVGEFVDAASAGRSAGVGLGQAIENLGFAFRTSNSQLGNLSGIPENFEDINKTGADALRNLAIEQGRLSDAERIRQGLLTKSEKLEARRLGILQATQDTTGAFGRVDDPIAEFDKQITDLQTTLGEGFIPALTELIDKLTPLLELVTGFVAENPEFATTIFVLATAVSGLLSFVSGLISAFIFIGPIIGAFAAKVAAAFALFNPAFLAGVAVIGLIIGAIQLFKKAYEENFGGFKDFVDGVKNFVVEKFNDLVNFFKELPGKIADGVSSGKDAVVNAFKGIWEGIQNIFSSDLFKGIINLAIIDPLNTLLNLIPDKVIDILPGVNDDVKSLLKDGLPRLANGGMLAGKNRMAMLNDGKGRMAGQEFVVNAPATSMFGPLLQAMNNAGRNGSTSINNSRTVNITNMGGGGSAFQYQTLRAL